MLEIQSKTFFGRHKNDPLDLDALKVRSLRQVSAGASPGANAIFTMPRRA